MAEDQEKILVSHLTCASATDSDTFPADHNGSTFSQHHFGPPPIQLEPPLKKKRNLPGNPDPEAQVIRLSPKSLMATNRFMCEVCKKGFQRDQNLQLHRRGHNLPWKLKQRKDDEVMKKKVYVCPEAGCVHHDPSRALGDLTGIKKHFCRKHGEKKWKCDKCSKRYAVQSDWKAHSKTCGTREYRCDCGTLFSRRDSFVTHRAFCDALAEESARSSCTAGLNYPSYQSQQQTADYGTHFQVGQFNANNNNIDLDLNPFSLKKEDNNFPQWLACLAGPGLGPPPAIDHRHSPSSPSSSPHRAPLFFNSQELTQSAAADQNPNLINSSLDVGPILSNYHVTSAAAAAASAHMSATALLQKAAEMGATISTCSKASCTITCSSSMMMPHQQDHDHDHEMDLASFGRNKGTPSYFHPGMLMSSTSGCSSTSFDEDALVNGFMDGKKEMSMEQGMTSDGMMTRDFLGLRPLVSHSHLMTMTMTMAGQLDNCFNNTISSSNNALPGNQTTQTPRSW